MENNVETKESIVTPSVLNKKVILIGIGNCGSQIASLGERKYGNLFDSVYINTSRSDLNMVNANGVKIKIGNDDDVEGSGKNRSKMKSYLKDTIKDILNNSEFTNLVVDKKYAFIISSAAGGTGSGAGPILLDILRQAMPDTHFILVSVLPQLGASLMEQSNAIEYLNELYKTIGNTVTYMIYDNQTSADLSPTEALTAVNENVIDDIRVLTGVDNYPTTFDSIDDKDFENIITTPGRLIVTRVSQGLTEKVFEDECVDDLIIKTMKQSSHAETDRNKKVLRLGSITYFTDAVNKLYSSELPKLTEFIGVPVERYNHNAINTGRENLNFMHIVASGLSPINDRVLRITDRIDDLKQALADDEASKYVLGDDENSYNARNLLKDANEPAKEQFNLNDIFSKFE